MSLRMWAGTIGGDPRIVRRNREDALKAARDFRDKHFSGEDYTKIPVHAVSVEVEL